MGFLIQIFCVFKRQQPLNRQNWSLSRYHTTSGATECFSIHSSSPWWAKTLWWSLRMTCLSAGLSTRWTSTSTSSWQTSVWPTLTSTLTCLASRTASSGGVLSGQFSITNKPHMICHATIKSWCQSLETSLPRYVQLPGDEVDTHLLQDATRKEAAQSKQWSRGECCLISVFKRKLWYQHLIQLWPYYVNRNILFINCHFLQRKFS